MGPIELEKNNKSISSIENVSKVTRVIETKRGTERDLY
jgi:hypothetical protein